MLCLCATLTQAVFVYLCICVFVYLYLGNEEVVVGEWTMEVISFQKIYGLYGLKHQTMEINGDVTMETNKRRTKSENRASQQIDQGLLTFAIPQIPNMGISNSRLLSNSSRVFKDAQIWPC